MRITSLSLTNFRSFQETQSIDFAPVTLLFGPNSVGKSSVLMALFYLQQILGKGQCDPVLLEALGDKHVGGFKNLVNGRDLDKKIGIKVSLDKKGEIGSSYNEITDMMAWDFDILNDSPAADADAISIELDIGWSKVKKTAYVAKYKVWFDGELIAETTSDSGMKQPMITKLNFLHNLLVSDFDEDFQAESGEGLYVSKFHHLLIHPRVSRSKVLEGIKVLEGEAIVYMPIGFDGFAGALPRLGRRMETALESLDEAPPYAVRVHEILSDILVAPLDNLLALLNDSLCIGPLRVVPDARYQSNPYPQQKDWYTGVAAWDVLEKSEANIKAINLWMNRESDLNMGYSVRLKLESKQTLYSGVIDSPLKNLEILAEAFGEELVLELNEGNIGPSPTSNTVQADLQKFLAVFGVNRLERLGDIKGLVKRSFDKKAVLWDEINGIEVASSDIGVGVSQLFPLIVATVDRQKGIIACEQPELHVHPRIQVGIGDLLTQSKSKTTFLIETHSEHLILRILKRIRQTSEGDMPKEMLPVKPHDVSIVYMEPSRNGVKTKKIEIDEDGEFKQRWPHGFFVERSEELF